MSTSNYCKDDASKSKVVDLSDAIGYLRLLNIKDNEEEAVGNVCANCGKEGDNDMNTCNKCKKVKYCNAACKKKHRHKHKKDCDEYIRRAAENAAELHDEKLFKQPPPAEDCPICFIRLPILETGWKYKSCCGKVICSGCIHAPVYDNQGNEVDEEKCHFCRTPRPTSIEEMIKRYKKRVELDDPIAIYLRGNYVMDGRNGFPQDYEKAFELWQRSGELGYPKALLNIGFSYHNGIGLEVDKKKANHYYELAAIAGDTVARNNLGGLEANAGNMSRALKHWMIAVRGGWSDSLDGIKRLYTHGHATKEDYMKALKLYQEYLGEIKSDQRDKAAAANEEYRYY